MALQEQFHTPKYRLLPQGVEHTAIPKLLLTSDKLCGRTTPKMPVTGHGERTIDV